MYTDPDGQSVHRPDLDRVRLRPAGRAQQHLLASPRGGAAYDARGASVLVPSVDGRVAHDLRHGGPSRPDPERPVDRRCRHILRFAGDRSMGALRPARLGARADAPPSRGSPVRQASFPGTPYSRRVTERWRGTGHRRDRSFTPARTARSGGRGAAAPRRRTSGPRRWSAPCPGTLLTFPEPLRLSWARVPEAPGGGGTACSSPGRARKRRRDVSTARVALTFDDGPSEWTEPILEILAEHDAHATFFVVGSVAGQRAHLLRRMVADRTRDRQSLLVSSGARQRL